MHCCDAARALCAAIFLVPDEDFCLCDDILDTKHPNGQQQYKIPDFVKYAHLPAVQHR